MEELLQKFAEGKLEKDDYKKLFSGTYDRKQVLDGLYDQVVQKNGKVSYEAARVFCATYDELPLDKVGKLDPEAILNVVENSRQGPTPVFRLRGLLELETYQFALDTKKEEKLAKLDEQTHKRENDNLQYMSDNVHFPKEFFQLRKDALDKTFEFIKNCPDDALKSILPDAKIETHNLTEFLAQNWDKLTDKQMLKAVSVVDENFNHNLKLDIDLKVAKLPAYVGQNTIGDNRDHTVFINLSRVKYPKLEGVDDIDLNRIRAGVLLSNGWHEDGHLAVFNTGDIQTHTNPGVKKTSAIMANDIRHTMNNHSAIPFTETDALLMHGYMLKKMGQEVLELKSEAAKKYVTETAPADLVLNLNDKDETVARKTTSDIDPDLVDIAKNMLNLDIPEGKGERAFRPKPAFRRSMPHF